jgi:predicted MFS family arabinose efflux permease
MVLRLGYIGRLVPMAGMAVLAFVRPGFSFWVAVALYAVFQVVWPLLSVASNDLAASLAPFGEGPAIGLFSAAAAVGSAFGALAGGVIADRVGYAAVLAFAAVAIAVALPTVRQQAASYEALRERLQ